MEVNAGGEQVCGMRNLQVEFGIFHNGDGNYKAYNVTLPGGLPLTKEAIPPDSIDNTPAPPKRDRDVQMGDAFKGNGKGGNKNGNGFGGNNFGNNFGNME